MLGGLYPHFRAWLDRLDPHFRAWLDPLDPILTGLDRSFRHPINNQDITDFGVQTLDSPVVYDNTWRLSDIICWIRLDLSQFNIHA